MKILNSLIFAFLLTFFISKHCQAFSININGITDLASLDSSGFATEANSWSRNSVPCATCFFSIPSTSSCDPVQNTLVIYGGPSGGGTYKTTYTNSFGPWYTIGVEIEVWVFATAAIPNAASLGQTVSIQVGGTGFGFSVKTYLGSCSTNFVTSQGKQIQFIYKYRPQCFHSLGGGAALPSSLNFYIYTYLTANAAIDSIGVRNVRFYNMGTASSSQPVLDSFPCQSGSYWNAGNCQPCFAGCVSCTGPLGNQCTSCTSPKYLYADNTCATCTGPFMPSGKKCVKRCTTGFYWDRDQSCVTECKEPLVQSTDSNGFAVCSSPCGPNPLFVYPDKTCSLNCNPPLQQRNEATVKYCLSPCLPSGAGVSTLFLYPNGVCETTCPANLHERTDSNNIKYCESTCSSTTPFVYPNGDCLSTCDPPVETQSKNTISLCNSRCAPGEYLYADGSCKTCQEPWSQRTEHGIQYCDNSCFPDQKYLYEDGICRETCTSPAVANVNPLTGKTCQLPCPNIDYYYNTQNGKCTKTCEYPAEAFESMIPKLCVSSLSEEEVKQVKAMANAASGANTATGAGAMIWSVISSGDSTSACLGPLAKMLQYIKFMDIRFPEKVLIMMSARNKDAAGGFATKMMKDVLKKFPSHDLPRKFKTYQPSSSFFVNMWPALFNLVVILLVTVLVIVLTAYTKGQTKINGFFKSLCEILKWNVFLITFSGSIGDIVLFTALEFQTMQFDNGEAVLSFISCLGINLLAILVVIKIIEVNSTIRREKKKSLQEEQKKIVEQEWASYKALFECYKDYSFYQQIFLFVFLVRLALFNAMIGYLYNYPLFQAATAVVSNIMMLAYLVIKRPMKKLVNLIQQIVLELVLLPFNVCVLALAIMDRHEIVGVDQRKSIGDVIVYINIIAPILSLVLITAKVVVMAVDMYKSWKLGKVKNVASIKKDFRPNPNDLLNTTEAHQFQTTTEAASPNKSFTDAQTLDMTDQSLVLGESHWARPVRNPRIRALRPNFMSNHYQHQNSTPMERSPNVMTIQDYQNSFQPQHQYEQQNSMGIMREELPRQHSQIPRRRINKNGRVVSQPSKIKFGN